MWSIFCSGSKVATLHLSSALFIREVDGGHSSENAKLLHSQKAVVCKCLMRQVYKNVQLGNGFCQKKIG